MAIPHNQFTLTPVLSAFLPPLTDPYDPLTMRATGGVAINNGSQGREVQFWTVSYDGTNILVSDAGEVVRFVLAVADVLAVSLAFDSNMAVALGYMTVAGGHLYFYNGLHNAYETIDFPTATSCRVAVDKTTRFFEAQSDVVFAYVASGSTVHYRYQRDRYLVEYDVDPQPTITVDNPLIRLGPTLGNRLEFEYFVAGPPVPPVPLGSPIALPRPKLQIVRVARATPRYS